MSLPWIINRIHTGNLWLSNYQFPEIIAQARQQKGGVRIKFENLLQMKRVWSQLVFTLLNQTGCRKFYSWNPHTWFYIVESSHQEKLLKAFRAEDIHMHKLIGSRTPLDRQAEKYLQSSNTTFAYAPGLFKRDLRNYFSLVGDWIVKISLSKKTAEQLEIIYQYHSKSGIFDLRDFIAFFQEPQQATLQVEFNPAVVKKLQKPFTERVTSSSR